MKKANADGVMIGRGCYGRPWFLNQVDHYLKTGEKLPDPDTQEIYETLLEHVEAMLSFYEGYTGARIARKHVAWYSKKLYNSSDFRAKINLTKTGKEVMDTIHEYFKTVFEYEAKAGEAVSNAA